MLLLLISAADSSSVPDFSASLPHGSAVMLLSADPGSPPRSPVADTSEGEFGRMISFVEGPDENEVPVAQ